MTSATPTIFWSCCSKLSSRACRACRAESREVLRQLRYRRRLVKISVTIKNNLHAIALGAGLSLQAQLSTRRGQERLLTLLLSGALADQRAAWLRLLERVGEQLADVERWLQQQASQDIRVARLRTQPGVGLLRALCLVHTLGEVRCFASTRKVGLRRAGANGTFVG